MLNDPVVRRHRAAVAGLEPGTVYRYASATATPDGWGPLEFGEDGARPGRPVRFLYLGDAQTGLERWGRLLEAAARRHPDLDFVMLAGDLVDRGNERTNWDHFFLRAAPVFDRLPVMPCVGNHEYLDVGPRLYRAFFELPRNGPRASTPDLVYSFEAGDACFAVLDSTLAVSRSVIRPTAGRVARRDTSDGPRPRWKLVMFHHPVYPSHPWRDMPGAAQAMGADLRQAPRQPGPARARPRVSQDLSAPRAPPRRGSPDQGTIYVIAVSGDKYVDQPHRDYIEVGRADLSTYQTIEIDPESNRLHYRAGPKTVGRSTS